MTSLLNMMGGTAGRDRYLAQLSKVSKKKNTHTKKLHQAR